MVVGVHGYRLEELWVSRLIVEGFAGFRHVKGLGFRVSGFKGSRV